MKNFNFLFLFLAFVSQVAFAQLGSSKKDDVTLIKDRVLLIVVEEPKAELMDKLKDDDKTFYQTEIDEYNALIKKVLPKYWKFSTKIEFQTRTEVNKLVKSKNEKYAYLEYSKFRVHFSNSMGLKATKNMKNGKFNLVGGYEESSFDIRLCEDNPLGVPVYGVYMPSVEPNEGEMVYALKQMQLQLNRKLEGLKDIGIYSLYKDNARQMSGMKLLIDKELLNIEENEIEKYYTFPYEVVDKARIDKAFVDEESGVFTFVFIPRSGGETSTVVVDTKDGNEMGRTDNSRTTGVSVSVGNMDKYKKEFTKGSIRKDDLKIIAKQGSK